jgi:putative PIN family toxin of toxin-antitoxin system
MRHEPSDVPRAVLDTNVLVSALITPAGASAQLIVELRDGAFELVVSPLLLAELDAVLRRPKFRRYVSGPEISAYVEAIRHEAVEVADPAPASEPWGVDPGDQFLIDLARYARVDALVSGDVHLLDLRDRLPVMSPRAFLDLLAARQRPQGSTQAGGPV